MSKVKCSKSVFQGRLRSFFRVVLSGFGGMKTNLEHM